MRKENLELGPALRDGFWDLDFGTWNLVPGARDTDIPARMNGWKREQFGPAGDELLAR